MEPRGILRNKETKSAEETRAEEFDRQEVIRNTRLNAQLAAETNRGKEIRAKIAEAKGDSHDARALPEHLKWDELNLYQTEQEKAATMKIDEPKTPYEGGFDPEGEYYRDDGDEDTGPGEIPELLLGEGEYDMREVQSLSLNGGELINPGVGSPDGDEQGDAEPEAPALLAEERHKRFEEMRKAHYHNAANPLKHEIDIPDVDESEQGPDKQ
ncbi:hypothetical protein METBIDRAFT_38703 [Metschnikowia bicuspidata var. bicuspidata NRRL YB-4993]|uniref:Protein phosphatase inhibitor 2 n=1 Tax=Metschnikowia bicuspidata var. bicuspidata NRRL YB-4993 TaxID=869754 RepID=A0A1A0HDU0_9ASCO|nr:hypothetical protein METBIDRAFT_38703 [Metschnikowia bicuspidata var. bicuspidata NRRL YB-4993]OBA22259.1 hypothetical protein METBIDRAFT_38703 [Metschnikowia bicuspidata var. bicuspidata NRRL YB-4993]